MAPAPADDWEDFSAWDHEHDYGADIRLPPAERGGSLPFLADAYAALDRGGAVGQGTRDGRQFRIKFLGSCLAAGGYAGCRDGWPTGSTLNLLSCASAQSPLAADISHFGITPAAFPDLGYSLHFAPVRPIRTHAQGFTLR